MIPNIKAEYFGDNFVILWNTIADTCWVKYREYFKCINITLNITLLYDV